MRFPHRLRGSDASSRKLSPRRPGGNRNRPRVTEPWQTYHDSDPTHYGQAYAFGVVHLEHSGQSQAAAERIQKAPRLYANPHGIPTVGTVPTVRHIPDRRR